MSPVPFWCIRSDPIRPSRPVPSLHHKSFASFARFVLFCFASLSRVIQRNNPKKRPYVIASYSSSAVLPPAVPSTTHQHPPTPSRVPDLVPVLLGAATTSTFFSPLLTNTSVAHHHAHTPPLASAVYSPNHSYSSASLLLSPFRVPYSNSFCEPISAQLTTSREIKTHLDLVAMLPILDASH